MVLIFLNLTVCSDAVKFYPFCSRSYYLAIRENTLSCDTKQLVCRILFSLGLCVALKSPIVNANSEEKLNPSSDQPSIEILAMSRGRGVPETTLIVFQEIMAVANTALESGSATSVKQESIGLEGEIRLCITFRDDQAIAALDSQIRRLAKNIDLLQINNNRCSGN